MHEEQISRILVYRLGSIGDFVISLPCFHLLRRQFSNAKIALLTNQPNDHRAVPAASVLGNSGLIDRYMTYPLGTRSLRALMKIRKEIRVYAPDLLVYLAAPRGYFNLLRDETFFRWWCRIPRILGIPFARDLRHCRAPQSRHGLWEREADRLGRCIGELGSIEAIVPNSWDLRLTTAEIAEADRALNGADFHGNRPRWLGLGIGTKQVMKDWGDEKWQAVLSGINDANLGLVLIGAAEERERSMAVARVWLGPVVNLCGLLSPRVSAAALKHMDIFLCNDSGPMHLAAAVGTRCVVVFSKKNLPGQWYPFGTRHEIFYPPPDANSIQAIRPEQVIEAALRAINYSPGDV